MSRGKAETDLLRENIEDQLKRLLTQLEDVEHMKEELDEEEYQSTRKDTVEQLQEFEQSLSKMLAGNITLVDHLNAAQLAIQAAIRDNASPDILQMFLKKENGAMRTRLSSLESDYKLGRINQAVYEAQAIGILGLLEKLKEPLSVAELALLNKQRKNMGEYESAGTEVGSTIMQQASKEIHKSSA